MPTHMRQQQHPRAGTGNFGVEVIKVETQILVDLDQHSIRAHRPDRAGHRGQRIGVGQHLVPRCHVAGAQGDLQRLPARGDGKAVAAALPITVFGLKLGRFPSLPRREVIPVQAA